MVGVVVKTELGDARGILDKVIALGQSPRPLMEAAADVLENSVRDRFRTSSGPGGIPWKPSGRVLHGGSGRTLVDKGGLVSSITNRVGDDRVEVGIIAKTTSAKFAHVHQFGSTIRPKKAKFLVFTAPDGHKVFAKSVTIPARPFIGIDDEDRANLRDAWEAYLESLV